MNAQLREWIPPFRLPEKLLAGAAVLWVVTWFTGFAGLQLVAWLVAMLIGLVVAARVGRFFIGKLIWRLRNRLLVAFLFMAVIPIGLVVALGLTWIWIISGQFAVQLARSEMDSRIQTLVELADDESRTAGNQNYEEVDSLARNGTRRFPGLSVAVSGPRGLRHVFGRTLTVGNAARRTGLFVVEGKLFGGAFQHSSATDRDVVVLAPLGRNFLNRLIPNIGIVSLQPAPGDKRKFTLDDGEESENPSTIPPRSAWWDTELSSFTLIPITYLDSPQSEGFAIFLARARMATVVSALFPQASELGNLLPILYAIAALIVVAEIISLILGFSITRTITAAVHELYDGTERVMRGEFSHRIAVSGNEQIADLSRSFNGMTANVERLLAVSKEKERMQAELDVARRVQQQLFPSELPKLETLELRAICQPARQVSGDYYDYQGLPDQRVVLALGDVAGKGISAALLMASLQSTLRVQLREWQNGASTERLVTGLNQHLFLNTAPEKYATFFLALYDEKSGLLEYTNAGHLPPLLVRKGAVTRLDVNGTVVGAFAKSKYDSSRVQLEPGDLLVCYTDGVSELENEFGEMFGEERLAEVLLKTGDVGLEQVEAAVLQAAAQFCAEAQDDLTMLMVRRR